MDIREESPRPDRAFLADVGPWHLRAGKGAGGYLTARASRTDPDGTNAMLTAVGATAAEVLASMDRVVAPLAGEMAGDVADGLAEMFGALETAESPPAPPAANPVDLRIQVGLTDV